MTKPPPTVPDDNGAAHLHRREGDPRVRTHYRWYDGWKGAAIVMASLAGAVTFGYATNDLVSQIRQAPASAQANRDNIEALRTEVLEEHRDFWRAINKVRDDLASTDSRIDTLTDIVWEVYCIVYADPGERERCMSEAARRRLDQVLRP